MKAWTRVGVRNVKGARFSLASTAVRVLGPVQVGSGDQSITPPAGRISTLLALLALDSGRVVSVDRLMDQLWGDDLPRSGSATLHVYVSRLRKVLDQAGVPLVRRTPGYLLDVPRGLVDAHRLAEHVAAAEASAAEGLWSEVLSEAEAGRSLVRGDPFVDAVPCPDLVAEAARLRGLADRAAELAALALVRLERAAEALPMAVDLSERHPFEENYLWLRMTAAQHSGRSPAALTAFDSYRVRLADELGLDPGPKLTRLQLAILRNDQPPPPSGNGSRPAEATKKPALDQDPVLTKARAAELARLDAWLATTLSGSGGLVLIEGEPGVGKTFLAEVAADQARQRGARVVWTRAIDGLGTPAMWMWEQVLDALGGGRRSGADQLRDLARASGGGTAGEPAEQARFRLSEALVRAVLGATREGPLILVFDDVQWADLGTMHTLRLLTDALPAHPLGVLVTARSEASGTDLSNTLAALTRSDVVQAFALGPFSADEVATYVQQARGVGLEPAEANALQVRSGGNPFLLSEIVRAGVSTPGVPRTIAGLVAQRLAALPDNTRGVLQPAAVQGRRVDLQLVARALDLTAVDALERIGPAVQAGILVNDGGVGQWTFAHDLTREAIIETVTPVRSAALHARLADAIGHVYGDQLDEHANELAHHLFESVAGSPSATAFAACMAAADLAASRLAYDQAAQQRARALATMITGPDTRRERFGVLLRLTNERRLAGDVIGAAASLRQAIDVARRLQDRSLIVQAVALYGSVTLWNWRQFGQVDADTVALLEDLLAQSSGGDAGPDQLSLRQRAELSGALAVELYYDPGSDVRRVELAQEAVSLARRTNDSALLGRVLNNLVIARWTPGADAARAAALDESLSWAGRGLPPTTEVVARLHRAPLHLRAGNLAGFDDDLERAAALAPRLGVLEIEGQVDTQRAGRALLHGDRDLASSLVDRAYAELRRTNLWGAEWVRLVQLTTSARLDGRLAEFTGHLVTKASEDVHRTLRWTALLALAEEGDLDQARAMQDRWNLRRLGQHAYWGSDFERAQAAEIALLLGTPDPAEVYAALLPASGELVVAGTGLAVWGPVAHLLSRLASALGADDEAERWRAQNRTMTVRIAANLGHRPLWVYPSPPSI